MIRDKTLILEIIGKNLRILRRKHNLSQTELGKHLGITFQQIQKYEKGKNRLPVDYIHTLKMLFDVPYETFFQPPPTSKALQSRSVAESQNNAFYNPSEHINKTLDKLNHSGMTDKAMRILDILAE